MLEVLLVDASLVIVKGLSRVHSTPNGSSLPNLHLHVGSSSHVPILISIVAFKFLLCPAVGRLARLGRRPGAVSERLMSGLEQSSTGPPSTASYTRHVTSGTLTLAANSYTPAGLPPSQEPPARQLMMACAERARLGNSSPPAIWNLSARAERVPWAQQLPQYWGMCWLTDQER